MPYSDDAHAYAVIPVPIAVLAGGPGPTVLLAGGVHGDEYEGPIALHRLLHTLDPAVLRGRLILLPALNLPAVRAARRTSPVDGANMNRAFPGHADGGPTAQIAYYVEHTLLPLCQAALDLHSGGAAAEYLPCAYVYAGGPMAAAKQALADAFGAKLAMVVGATAETRSLSAACERQNVPMISAELGGGACVNAAALNVAETGISAVLRHLGLLPAQPGEPARRTSYVHVPDRSYFLMASSPGLFLPAAALGDEVAEGQHAGTLYDPENLAAAPIPVAFTKAGRVVTRRLPALTRRGDTLFTTAIPTDGP